MFLKPSVCVKSFIRSYAFKSDLKIRWNRPEKIACYDPRKSGDLSSFPEIPKTDVLQNYAKSQELQLAEKNVQKIFQLGHNPRKESVLTERLKLIQEVQRHPLDYGSIEAKLASMTLRIRSMQVVMSNFPRNKKVKVQLKELIDKRKKFLKFLRRWDYKRFEWIIEKLDIVFKAPPPEFHWITRKESLQKLTNTHCENLKQERLTAYRQKLETEQIEFLENKIKKLQLIRSLQESNKIPIDVSDEKINAIQQQLKQMQVK